jgi:hypothetical protein
LTAIVRIYKIPKQHNTAEANIPIKGNLKLKGLVLLWGMSIMVMGVNAFLNNFLIL